jgi:hypothetical protein
MKVVYRYEISEKCEDDPVKLAFPSEAWICAKPSPPID